ncbi:MAG: phenylalanine--tRNA ligase subunit beta [Bernardetiaceae bacterium]
MKISLHWLQRFIALDTTPEEISNLLTNSGLEVEGIEVYEEIEGNLQGLVIGEVRTCTPHPNADKLRLTTVDVGQEALLSIVCGAPNVAAGQKVVVALVGTTLYPAAGEPFKIKKSKIRGESSEGMICAEDEMGLGQSHDGILVLDTDLPNGTPAAEYFKPFRDQVLEIGLTPNRADAASHWGAARDLQVLLDTPAKLPEVSIIDTLQEAALHIPVTLRKPEACPRYSSLTLTGVKVQESPSWLQNALRSIGLKPINNIVDVTNYVLHGLGQPLHAFDAQRIEGQSVIVDTLPEGTPFVGLDGVTYTLSADDLMICDGAGKPMCMGGVFGGLSSGIQADTASVFLESAYFSPDYIRKSSTVHQLKTDAAYRFARGTDPNMTVFALRYAAGLIVELSGGVIASPISDVYPNPIQSFKFQVKWKYLHKIIGQEIPKEKIIQILEGLEIKVDNQAVDDFTVIVPPYRVDVTRPADIAEEVLRMYGFNNIHLEEHLRTDYLASFPKPDPNQIQAELSAFLSGNGWNEIMTNSLTSSRYTHHIPGFDAAGQIPIQNPLSEDLDIMRPVPVFSGLEVIRHNLNRQNTDLRLFEFAKTYSKIEEKYIEKDYLVFYWVGSARTASWMETSRMTSFYDLGQVVELVARKFGQPLEEAQDMVGQGIWQYGRELPGVVRWGLVNKKIAKLLEVNEDVFYAAFDWAALLPTAVQRMRYREPSRFPSVVRDLSLVVSENVRFEQIEKLAFATERKFLKEVRVFDVFADAQKLGSEKKAYAIKLHLQDEQNTLTDKAIDKTMQRLIKTFEVQLGAYIRQ